MPRLKAEMRMTYQTLKVLRAFSDAYNTNVRKLLAGSDIMRTAHVSSGTLYPALYRLEDAGLLVAQWEDEPPEALGRPQRRLYRLTPKGAEFAQRALATVTSPWLTPATQES